MHPLALLDDAQHVWTADELNALELEDWFRYEIIDGALLVSPSPTPLHELAAEELRTVVRAALPSGRRIVGPLQVDLGVSVPVPDLMVVDLSALRTRSRMQPTDLHLAVEVMSPSSVSADRILKPALYAAAGIAHYWRVEIDPLLLTAYALDGDTYREVGTWRAGEVARLDTPVTVAIDIAGLLPEA